MSGSLQLATIAMRTCQQLAKWYACMKDYEGQPSLRAASCMCFAMRDELSLFSEVFYYDLFSAKFGIVRCVIYFETVFMPRLAHMKQR
jgi:hypothetical protein